MMSKEKETHVLFLAMFVLALITWAYIVFCFVLSIFGSGSLVTQ